MKNRILTLVLLLTAAGGFAQKKPVASPASLPVPVPAASTDLNTYFKPLHFRDIGPYRGGRSVTATGVAGQPFVYYMGTCGGGLWKTDDAGITWSNVSDGFFKTGSVGAVAVSESDPNVVYVGMGEHAPRGVMTSYGDGVYKSTDAGKTWQHLGLALTRQISWIRIHPTNPDVVYVAAQGALNGPGTERGVYKSSDGGKNWRKVLFVDENTGCADLAMDPNNARILYAAMWDHRRLPWEVRSGGKGSGFYKSSDAGETWEKLSEGLPEELGKISVSVSKANSEKIYLLAESDTEKELGGLFVSYDAGKNFSRISKDHRLTQRAWYYIEVTADPGNEEVVYVLNSPAVKSIDGGKTWEYFEAPHGDYHQLWINPTNSRNLIMANDGGAAISFNGGKTWSSQDNQPTAQFYRINADNLFPYNIYAGQQDNSSVRIASRNISGGDIDVREWAWSAGGESAFLAFDPNNPTQVMGGSYQGTISLLDINSMEEKLVMVAPIQYQALQPKDMKYRFNWNAPIIHSQHETGAFYHGANVLLKTTDGGKNWQAISPDLTRNDKSKQGISGVPYTNEGAGGENYGTLAYVMESPLEAGVIYTGSDDGLVHITRDGGKTWTNITPAGLEECLVNCIEVSPHDKATAYIATTRYKVNDFAPSLYKTSDYGKTWTKIITGIPNGAYTRCIREDQVRKGLLFAGTETGLYLSFDAGARWTQMQLGLPITPVTDLKVHQGDLIAATMGRSFWILDDLHILRQYDAAQASASALHLFNPEDAYRLSAYGSGNYSAESRKGSTTGANPPNAVVVYYQLPASVTDSSELTLSVYDAQRQLVRRYASQADPEFVDYPGGPDAEHLLSLKPGLNRFMWDMRHETLPGVPTVYIEGSYAGRRAAPGTYTLVLTMGKDSVSTSARVLPHPKIKATEAEYAAQQALSKKVDDECSEIHREVVRMRKVRSQIETLSGLIQGKAGMEALQKQGKALTDNLLKWEEQLVQNKSQSNDDVINYVNKLSADYIFLRWELDANIPAVTTGQSTRYQELNALWTGLKTQLEALKKELTAFNEACEKAGVQQIVMP